MSESKRIDVNSLYTVLLREIENDIVQEVNTDLYSSISEYLGQLKSEGYDGLEAKVKAALVNMVTEMTSFLLKIRIEKSIKSNKTDYTNLLDEEKFIIDSQDEMQERKGMVLSAALNGKSKLLESIAKNHKTKSTVVRFLKDIDQMVGADMEKYGPFQAEDVATLPYDNAQALIAKKIAMKIRWKD